MNGLEGVSASALSEAIGAIYDCALDPDHWPNAMRHVTELTASAVMGMGIIDHKHRHNVRMYEYGFREDMVRLYFDKYAAMNPFFVARLMFPVGEPVTTNMLIDEQDFATSRYYEEFLKPNGYKYGATIEILRTPHRSVGIALIRKEEKPAYGAEDLGTLRLLSPHFCRALAISDVLDLRTLKSEMLEATLDGLAAGVYLTARDGRVVYMNVAAERQVKSGNALRIVNKKLCPVDPRARATMVKAIEDLGRDEAGASGAHSLAVPDAEGAGYVATLLPIERGQRRSGLRRARLLRRPSASR
jgi:PAS domain-containing protein